MAEENEMVFHLQAAAGNETASRYGGLLQMRCFKMQLDG
jgi:hypothetical protein